MRRNKGAFVEGWFATNLKRRREAQGITQTDLALRMRERGYPFHQQTIQRIEQVEDSPRPVRLGEAIALSEILGTQLYVLTRPPDEFEIDQVMEAVYGTASRLLDDLRKARDELSKTTSRLIHPGISKDPKTRAHARSLCDEIQLASDETARAEQELKRLFARYLTEDIEAELEQRSKAT